LTCPLGSTLNIKDQTKTATARNSNESQPSSVYGCIPPINKKPINPIVLQEDNFLGRGLMNQASSRCWPKGNTIVNRHNQITYQLI